MNGRMASFPAFARLAAIMVAEGAEPPGGHRGFGSEGVKTHGKLFAMPLDGRLALKLPRERVDGLVSAGQGVRLDPAGGRPMREWISLDLPEAEWPGLAREARRFVASEAEKPAVRSRGRRAGPPG